MPTFSLYWNEKWNPSSYQPISMLNLDFKILTIILENTKQLYRVCYQHGSSHFVPRRWKAFSQVEWRYLLRILKEFGLSASFISWGCLIYHATPPSLQTRINYSPSPFRREHSRAAPSHYFILVMVTLAIRTRGQTPIKLVTLGLVDHKILLYMEDITIFVSNPKHELIYSNSSIPLETFQVTPKKWQKTRTLQSWPPLNDFKITSDSIKYLCIRMPKNPKTRFDFIETLNKLNTEKWKTSPLSLTAHVNTAEMVSLLRFWYLFQSAPIFIPRSSF